MGFARRAPPAPAGATIATAFSRAVGFACAAGSCGAAGVSIATGLSRAVDFACAAGSCSAAGVTIATGYEPVGFFMRSGIDASDVSVSVVASSSSGLSQPSGQTPSARAATPIAAAHSSGRSVVGGSHGRRRSPPRRSPPPIPRVGRSSVVQTVADTKVAACSASLLEWVGRRHLERLVLDAEALRRGVQGHTGVHDAEAVHAMIAFAEIGIDAVYLSRTGFMKPRWIRT